MSSEYVYVYNVASNLVLEASGGRPGDAITLQKQNTNSDAQLWKYEGKYAVNKASGLVVEAPLTSGKIVPGTPLIMAVKGESGRTNQQWEHVGELSISMFDPTLRFAEGGSTPGSPAIAAIGRGGDENELWRIRE